MPLSPFFWLKDRRSLLPFIMKQAYGNSAKHPRGGIRCFQRVSTIP